MPEPPEFPKADPAIQYLVRQCSKIEEQYACNAGYHKDHKAIKQRLDNLDEIISGLKKAVITIQEYQAKAEESLNMVKDLNSHLDTSVDTANQKVLKQFEGEHHIRLEELRKATREANETLRALNQNAVTIHNKYQEINERLKSEIKEEASQIIADAWQKNMIKYIITSVAFGILTFLIGILLGKGVL
jgi:cell division septum initiation protein DivIVA